MLERVEALIAERAAVEGQLMLPETVGDRALFRDLSRRLSELDGLMPLLTRYREVMLSLKEAEEMMEGELADIAVEQKAAAEEALPGLEEELTRALLPKNPYDGRNVMVEVRAGTGGEEAALFAGELARAYMRYAESAGFRVTLMDKSEAEAGGVKEIVFKVDGAEAYAHFKFEGGAHRVQRIPATESKGRIHTSAVTVAVLPEAEEVDIEIRQQDLRIDTYCAGGAGGQHVNRTESAVRITHVPTGVVAACQNERSQHQNKEVAMGMLRSKLLAHAMEEAASEVAGMRKGQVGTGDRSEKIRTYNFPQDRVTDHRVGENFSNLPAIMEGRLGSIVAALREWEVGELLKMGGEGGVKR